MTLTIKTHLLVSSLIMTSGCASIPKGGLLWGVNMADDNFKLIQPKCERGEVIYPQIDIYTEWKTGFQSVQYSWQCYVNDKDNKRIYRWLGTNGLKPSSD